MTSERGIQNIFLVKKTKTQFILVDKEITNGILATKQNINMGHGQQNNIPDHLQKYISAYLVSENANETCKRPLQ